MSNIEYAGELRNICLDILSCANWIKNPCFEYELTYRDAEELQKDLNEIECLLQKVKKIASSLYEKRSLVLY